MKKILTAICIAFFLLSLFLASADAKIVSSLPLKNANSANTQLAGSNGTLLVRDTGNQNVTHPVVKTPVPLTPLPGKNGTAASTSSDNVWFIIDLWGTTSGQQFPQYMSGSFVAASNTFSNLESGDYVIYEPINICYGTDSGNFVWFQFVVYFFADHSIQWSIWDFPNGYNGVSNTIPSNAYIPGHTYNFAITTTGNHATFNLEDATNSWSWSWGMDIPGTNIIYWPYPGCFSPASCIEGKTTNPWLTDVPTFTTTLGYGEITYFESWNDYVPGGIISAVSSAGYNYYYWSMVQASYPYLTVQAVSNWAGLPLYTDVVIDGIDYGSSPVTIQVTPGWHDVWVSDYVWNPYFWCESILIGLQYNGGYGSSVPVFHDQTATALYNP